MDRLLAKLKKDSYRKGGKIVFPESNDPRIVQAVRKIFDEHIAVPILLGKMEKISQEAKHIGLDLEDIMVVDMAQSADRADFIKTYYEQRKDKGITKEQAAEIMANPVFFATMMVKKGMADGMISGSLSPTADTLRPAFQIIGPRPGIKKVSGLFLMMKEKEHELLFFADSAVNIDPSSEELADIAITTADTAKSFGIDPVVAMLSFSTYGSASHPLVDKVRKAREIVNQKRPDLIVGGEMQFDAAFVPEVAKLKCPQSPVQGNANVFIFPNLECGNIGYKIAQRLGKFKAIGPILQGLQKPVNDLSRGCSVQDIIDMTIITTHQS
jgi:phosphate acetyltransferase